MPRNTFAVLMAVIVAIILVTAIVSGSTTSILLAVVFAGAGVAIYSSLPAQRR